MIPKVEEICGSFAVITEKRKIKKVIVIQDVLSYYEKEKSYSKTFRLESFNGFLSIEQKILIFFAKTTDRCSNEQTDDQ